MKNKICTSLEQSQKLLELGIDVNTADMFWDTLFAKKPEAQIDNHHLIDEIDDEHRVPAWSLSSLLEVMKEPELIRNSEGKWLIRVWYHGYLYSKGGYDNSVDACVGMIEKLHKLNLL